MHRLESLVRERRAVCADADATPLKDERQDSQPSQAGSTPGSHTFDSALHEGIAELVKAPDSAAHIEQPAQGNQRLASLHCSTWPDAVFHLPSDWRHEIETYAPNVQSCRDAVRFTLHTAAIATLVKLFGALIQLC